MLGRITKVFLIGLAVSILTAAFAAAQAPSTISYQGRLTNAAGQPITATTSVVFAIYSASTGGTALYTTTKSVTPDDNGIFTVELGPFATTVFDGSKRYLGIKAGTDAEMTPRQLITSAPYSLGVADAAGVGTSVANTGTYLVLTAADMNLDSVTITTPAPGYVVTIASAYYNPSHTNGTKDLGRFSISRTSATLDYNYLANITTAANVETSADLPMPVFLQRVDNVGAGTYKFYFTADQFSGVPRANRTRITAMYFPTAYGTTIFSAPTTEPNAPSLKVEDSQSGDRPATNR